MGKHPDKIKKIFLRDMGLDVKQKLNGNMLTKAEII